VPAEGVRGQGLGAGQGVAADRIRTGGQADKRTSGQADKRTRGLTKAKTESTKLNKNQRTRCGSFMQG